MADDLVPISVIMPLRNEARWVAASLGAVLAQDYPPELVEILVADGMSTDDTVARIHALAGGERVHIVANPRPWQASGLNLLLREASGEVIVRVDGHTIIAPDYLRQCLLALRASDADEVGGAIAPAGMTPEGMAIAAACRSPFAVPGAFHNSQKAQYVDTVYMGAWPRAVLKRLGGYDEHLRANEDYELNFRLRQRGGRIFYSPAIRSTYYGRQTPAAIARQYLLYGRAKAAMLRLHPTALRWRQMVAPAFVAALALGGVAALLNVVVAWLWLGMLALYALLAVTFTFRALPTRATGAMRLIPVIFFIIHLCWGFGFWVGLFARPTNQVR